MRFSPALRQLSWLAASPIAHRGLHDRSHGVVENTGSAFAAALVQGFAIECDLQISADGEAMVFHDDTLERLTGTTGPVAGRGARELQSLPIAGSADRMPTLGGLLTQVQGRVPLLIELKSQWNGDGRLALRALAVLEDYPGPHALMSFDPDVIETVRLASPHTPRGIVADRTVDAWYAHLPLARRLELRHLAHAARTRPHFLSYQFRDLPFAPVSLFHGAGRPVLSWTIRTPAEAAAARRYSDQITFEGFDPR